MKRSLFAAAIVSAVAGQAVAQEAGKPSFQINQALYVYQSMETESKPDGQPSSTVKKTEASLVQAGFEVVVGFHDLFLHFYPINGGEILLGWGGVKNLEVGLALADKRTTQDKPKESDTSTSIGVFGTYTVPMGKPALELGLRLNSNSGVAESTDAQGVKEKTETSGMDYGLNVAYVHSILGGLSYTAAIDYSADSGEKKVAGAKTKMSETTLAIVPAGLRLDF